MGEEATESDLMDLFSPFGKVIRIYLARDEHTQVSRDYAFVKFQNKDDAQRAISGVNGRGYNHLILKVGWACMNIFLLLHHMLVFLTKDLYF